MRTFVPDTGSEMEWNAAYYRLEDYLRALHLVNKVHQSQIILHLLEAAAEKHRADPDRNPTMLAMQECQEMMRNWFGQILGHQDCLLVAGLLPLFLADGVERWPVAFLEEVVPRDFQNAVKKNDVRASPGIQLSRMTPRPLDVDLNVGTVFHDGWEKLHAGSTLLACLAAVSVIAAIVLFLT